MYQVKLAGGQFRPASAKEITAQLTPGDYLYLEREPTNPYDNNAIKITDAGGTHLGYVPKEVAVELAPKLDEGNQFKVEVVGHLAPVMPVLMITSDFEEEESDLD